LTAHLAQPGRGAAWRLCRFGRAGPQTQWIYELPCGCPRVGLCGHSLLRPAAGHARPIHQPHRPCRCSWPCVLVFSPVPSGLF